MNDSDHRETYLKVINMYEISHVSGLTDIS